MTLPNEWAWTTLGEIARINYRDPAIRDLDDNLPVTFAPMAAVDAESGTIAKPEERPLSKVRKGFTSFCEDDVILAKITPCMENGKAAIARGLVNRLGFGSTEFHVLRPEQGVLPEWIFYFVRQSSFREDAKARFAGTAGQLRVPSSFLESYTVPLAPTPEQHRIVAEIEKQFTRLDAGVAALKRVQANLKRYKASVLKAACEGRLVPQDPNDEPASKLLARILEQRRKGAVTKRKGAVTAPQRKHVEPAPPDSDGLPGLPKGWSWTQFDDLLIELKNGHFSKAPASEPPGIPILRISAVRPLSVSLESPRYLQEEWEKVAQYQLHNGDLLFTRYNGTLELVGVCGTVRGLGAMMIYPDKLIRARIFEGILPDYLEVYFATDVPRRIIENKAKSTAGQQGIAGTDLKALPVAVPPSAEQRRIVAEVERRLSVVQEVEVVIAANLARAERLRQSILKQAFEGKLVPQDPNDEPASVLLERIKAHRVGAALVALDARAGARPALTRRQT